MFAKLFETDLGQILVKLDSHEDSENPEVRFFFEPHGLGICSAAVTMKDDSPESWDKADEFFKDVDEVKAVEMIRKVINEMIEPIKN